MPSHPAGKVAKKFTGTKDQGTMRLVDDPTAGQDTDEESFSGYTMHEPRVCVDRFRLDGEFSITPHNGWGRLAVRACARGVVYCGVVCS